MQARLSEPLFPHRFNSRGYPREPSSSVFVICASRQRRVLCLFPCMACRFTLRMSILPALDAGIGFADCFSVHFIGILPRHLMPPIFLAVTDDAIAAFLLLIAFGYYPNIGSQEPPIASLPGVFIAVTLSVFPKFSPPIPSKSAFFL